ncbi:LamG-like jellyroll fold domain-containing protein [Streptomyces xiangluensis]|uniref:LamG-like jellyroll fold domain-containing protein n=1 Tax=Streptomyces xiangluensis TaxID=2665720 RepID=A0ABV8YK54_9ACTN
MTALEPEDPRSVGDYRLLRRLGAGGMGRVYLGRSPGGRAVAVKVVHADLVRQPEFRSRFRREVQAARLVSGAFTAPVIDADPDAPLPWLVTSYISGPSLQDAVADRRSLPPQAVLALAAGLAEALTSIHAVNLVHRDLKPSNVLLAEDGPRVIDFGIARSAETAGITKAGRMVGSPGFMSPEQVAGDAEITWAGDVFSLGAVLAYAATGSNPFGDGPTPALLYRVVHTEPDIEAVTHPTLRALITACLVKDPARRPTPREILTRVGPEGAEGTAALLEARRRSAATEHTPTQVRDPRASYDPAVARADMLSGESRDAFAHQAHPSLPTHPATQLETAPPPSLSPVTRARTVPPPGADARGGGRSRRAFLYAGAAGVAGVVAVGTTAYVGLTGSDGQDGPAADRPGAPPAVPKPVGAWPLDEPSGSIARDTVGGNDGTASGVAWQTGEGGAAVFDGRSSQIVTRGPVLRTGNGRSFTVSARVRLSVKPGFFATAVSQDANANSGFYLQYSIAENRWAFARPGLRALSYSVPAVGTWTHLVGVCDSGKLRLYVDGVQEAEVDDANPIAANGALMIGRASHVGQAADFFPGAIKDVRVFQRALTSAQVKRLR